MTSDRGQPGPGSKSVPPNARAPSACVVIPGFPVLRSRASTNTSGMSKRESLELELARVF
jgi:hypothetical protein